MTILRQRMIEDMQLRGLVAHTQRGYIAHVAAFARYFDRCLQCWIPKRSGNTFFILINGKKMSPEGINQQVSALKFLYHNALNALEQ